MRLSVRLLAAALTKDLDNLILKKLDHYSGYHPSSLSMQQILDFGRKGDQKASYLFLRKELLVRLANIMKEISLLSDNLYEMPSVRLVRQWYAQSFHDLTQYEDLPPTMPTLTDFTTELNKVYERHAHVVPTMAEGVIEMKETHGMNASMERNLQYFLDRFYINRISIRMLISQHILLFGESTSSTEHVQPIGCVDPMCDVEEVINDAYENARFLCERYYMACPRLKIESKNAVEPGSYPITMVYVPSHLYHLVFELFKNAMRATVEYHGQDSDHLPDLKVFLVKGAEDLSIKICDRGGGVCRSMLEILFNYLYTTAPPPQGELTQPPLAGLGYGLPLSRLYARYFHGDLMLVSMEGYGTDACVYLKAASTEANELIPVYSQATKGQYKRPASDTDWSSPFGGSRSYRFYSTLRSPVARLMSPSLRSSLSSSSSSSPRHNHK